MFLPTFEFIATFVSSQLAFASGRTSAYSFGQADGLKAAAYLKPLGLMHTVRICK